MSMSVSYQTPTNLNLTPPLPPGGAVGVVFTTGLEPIVLGGASHPFLKSFSPFGGGPGTPVPVTTVAGPFPGNPVDVDYTPGDGAFLQFWGEPCSPIGQTMSYWWQSSPKLGNQSFFLGVADFNRPRFFH